MAKTARVVDAPPTMIIPKGTEIQLDEHGQLSVRTPGNLVIQDSGQYGNLESVSGSIRIESGVDVEAVSVRCPETCYVEGNLTAWKLAAHTLHLEDTARAHIVLQETERLEVGKGARLVGNFKSEKELFFLFSRFSSQVRGMPVYREGAAASAGGEEEPDEAIPAQLAAGEPGGSSEASAEEGSVSPPVPLEMLTDSDLSSSMELPDSLFFALVLLERDLGRGEQGKEYKRVVKEIVKLLKEPDLETLRHTYRTLFSRLTDPSDKAKRAQELVEDHFRHEP